MTGRTKQWVGIAAIGGIAIGWLIGYSIGRSSIVWFDGTGSAGEWIGGIGGILAFGVAVVALLIEHNRADEAEKRERDRHNDLLTHQRSIELREQDRLDAEEQRRTDAEDRQKQMEISKRRQAAHGEALKVDIEDRPDPVVMVIGRDSSFPPEPPTTARSVQIDNGCATVIYDIRVWLEAEDRSKSALVELDKIGAGARETVRVSVDGISQGFADSAEWRVAFHDEQGFPWLWRTSGEVAFDDSRDLTRLMVDQTSDEDEPRPDG